VAQVSASPTVREEWASPTVREWAAVYTRRLASVAQAESVSKPGQESPWKMALA
jgi:hypothetical protein